MGIQDPQEREQVQSILAELPYGHPARAAFRAGADASVLAQLVERPEMASRLMAAWEEAYLRERESKGRNRPTP